MISRGTKLRACASKQAYQRQRDAASHLREPGAAGVLPTVLRSYHCRLACRALEPASDGINKHTEYATITLRVTPFLPIAY